MSEQLPGPGAAAPGGRRRYRLPLAVGAAVAAAAATVGVVSATSPSPRPMAVAKNFSLPELGHPGSTISLASLAGRPVIINFFASWCGPCRQETPLLARFAAGQHGRVTVIGVDSNDKAAAAAQFLRAAGVRYPVGSDPFPATTTTSYGVYALPQTFVLTGAHRIAARIVGAATLRQLDAGIAAAAGNGRLTAAGRHSVSYPGRAPAVIRIEANK